jgi:hypothetical protein
MLHERTQNICFSKLFENGRSLALVDLSRSVIEEGGTTDEEFFATVQSLKRPVTASHSFINGTVSNYVVKN